MAKRGFVVAKIERFPPQKSWEVEIRGSDGSQLYGKDAKKGFGASICV